MTDGRSTGIPKILQAMKRNGSPKPEFDFDDDHTFFMCRLPVHPQATMPAGLTTRSTPGEGTPQGTPQVKRLIAALIAEQSQGRDELMAALKRKDRKTFAENYLSPALNNGLVEMTQPDSPNSPTQKYRLTAKGHALNDLLSMNDRT